MKNKIILTWCWVYFFLNVAMSQYTFTTADKVFHTYLLRQTNTISEQSHISHQIKMRFGSS